MLSNIGTSRDMPPLLQLLGQGCPCGSTIRFGEGVLYSPQALALLSLMTVAHRSAVRWSGTSRLAMTAAWLCLGLDFARRYPERRTGADAAGILNDD